MPITEADIKLVESERMTDTSDGGGRRTSREIPDGVIGNVFPKISRLDSVYGRVNTRKVYGWVDTADLDVYAGAHAIITDAPDNNRVHVTIFSTGSDFDTRTQARDRIESYVIAGPESRMRLYGRQLAGQQAIATYQRVEEPLPEIGDVLCLSHEQGSTTIKQQFVRITDIAHEVRTFEDVTGTFQRRLLQLKLSTTLRYEFAGDDVPVRILSQGTATAKVRGTTVADASRYYGIMPLVGEQDSGSLELTAQGVYSPLVPTTQRETAVSLAELSGAGPMVAAATSPITEQVAETTTPTSTWSTSRPIYPGSLSWTQGGTGVQYVDDGRGHVVRQADGVEVGVVDYPTGVASYTTSATAAIPTSATYTPAARVSQPAHTRRIPITLATRGTVYSETLLPIPAPGTTIMDFRALGRWYRLRDIGDGQIQGDDPAYGVGTIDYVTGALIVTLGALPDVGSAVLLAWGSPVHATVRTTSGATPPRWQYESDAEAWKPGTVVLTWEVDGVAKTAVDDGEGRITGDAVGVVSYARGQIVVTPLVLPDPGTTPLLEYEVTTVAEETFTPTADGNGMITVTLAGAPVVPRSVQILWQTVRQKTVGERTGDATNQVTYKVTPVAAPAEPVRATPAPPPSAPADQAGRTVLAQRHEVTTNPALWGKTLAMAENPAMPGVVTTLVTYLPGTALGY